ncbi:MAG: purine-nucleoside phosphorylase [Lachnospiraceae bacterium]|jgi:purine-nucleoside phosphorylase|nr:purine-nucleoside phosphorylase [Lachnospiraceae bacterium]
MNETVNACVKAIREKTDFVPRVALTLGSGLGSYGSRLNVTAEIPYRDLPGFPVSTAPGHKGCFLFGKVGDTPVVCMEGRVHYYEGYTISQVVLPARVMHALGAQILFLTNACGGINPSYKAGDLVLITDHISDFVPNPLIGPNDEDEGVRFPDMTHVYDPELGRLLVETASECGFTLKSGTYVQFTGPSFETPAEIRMLAGLGGDLVGMSTVVEAIAARHMGMRVVGVSLVSNLAAGISKTPLSSEEVAAAGKAAEPLFTQLVTRSISRM